MKEINGVKLYFTGKNYRVYLPMQLHESKETADEKCMWINHEGYQAQKWRDEVLKDELGLPLMVDEMFNRELLQEQLDKYGYFEW